MKKSPKGVYEDNTNDIPKKLVKTPKVPKPVKKTNQAHRDDAFLRLAEVAKNAKNNPDDITQGSFAEHAQVTGFGSEGNISSVGDAGFKLNTEYKPAGDQPKAIKSLVDGVKKGLRHQTLLGVTGSGKSVTGDTQVYIRENGIEKTVRIGQLIDLNLLSKHTEIKTIDDTEVLESKKLGFEALSISPITNEVEWKPIRQFTRHVSPSVLYKIETSCGRNVNVTDNHNFFVLDKKTGKLILKETRDVQIGDYVPTPLRLSEPKFIITSFNIRDYCTIHEKMYCSMLNPFNIFNHEKASLRKMGMYQKVYSAIHSEERIQVQDFDTLSSYFPSLEIDLEKGVGSESKKVSLPLFINIDEEMCRLFGYFIAEGHASNGYIVISSADSEIISDFSSALSKLGLHVFHRKDSYDYQASSTIIANVFKNLFGSHAQNKKLPSFWTQLSNQNLAEMLKAYFSADGGVDGVQITCTSASEELISQLSLALLRFGITTRLSERLVKVPNKEVRNTFWKLTVSGQKNLLLFQKHIGFSLNRKNKKLSEKIAPTYNTNVDIVPLGGSWIKEVREKLNLFQEDLANHCNISRSLISFYESSLRMPSRDVATAILSYFKTKNMTLNKKLSSKFESVASEIAEKENMLNVFWSPVKKIQEIEGEKYVYDFSVEDNETFLVGHGGMFVHNTYTAANVIAQVQKPTLVIAHNKTLAAQLAQEYKEFFPENAVHYFVSYYDYYQPEAYIAHSDTYIEKEAQINEEIDRLRHASTQALLTRKDVIIVASVSCIYGLGSPEEYEKVNLKIEKGMKADRSEFIRRLISLQFTRTNADLTPGTFRAVGNTMEIMPVNERVVYRLAFGIGQAPGFSVIEEILQIDAITRAIQGEVDAFFVFPAKHFVTPEDERQRAIDDIKAEMEIQVKKLLDAGKIIEAERIKRRTTYDLALIREVGYCSGIENYSRHFAGKAPGEAPDTLLSYFPHKTIQVKNPKTGKLENKKVPDFLTVVDESHVAIPQIGGMFAGDASRKKNLIDFGFRLPSAADNRPLKFAEFEERVGQLIYTSATPGAYEYEHSQNIAEQIIRPTGLIDPVLVVKPITALAHGSKAEENLKNESKGKKGATPEETKENAKSAKKIKNAEYVGQIFDFIEEAEKVIVRGQRAIATTLTKKMAEDLTEFLKERGIKTNYIHSDIETLDRIQILTEFRKGKFDVLVGVNLLREGLDLPEVSLIGILDADKEGFLRSETALIQTIGRAARNVDGRVILYADQMTGSMERAIKETNRRRDIQLAYNAEHGITPKTIAKKIQDITEQILSEHQKTVNNLLVLDASEFNKDPKKFIRAKEIQMDEAVAQLDFETAAILRDEIKAMKARLESDAKRAEKKRKDDVKGIRAKRQSLQ